MGDPTTQEITILQQKAAQIGGLLSDLVAKGERLVDTEIIWNDVVITLDEATKQQARDDYEAIRQQIIAEVNNLFSTVN